MRRRSIPFVAATALLAAATVLPAAAMAKGADRQDVIVVLKDSVSGAGSVAAAHARTPEVQQGRVYASALKGFSASVTGAGLAGLLADPRVAYVERDGPVTAFGTTQSPATWGLDRIDQRDLPLSKSFTYDSTGSGVTAYVIDTGVRTSHAEFGVRAIDGADEIDGALPADDCNGHGTHVAGTIGGNTYGVAKGVNIVAVRVLDCNGSGTYSGVIAGIDWVTNNHAPGAPAVANMSLGGGGGTALDTAVRNSIADGVSYAVASGNSSQDACRFSPARVPDAMTVSATDSVDRRPKWANYGRCVDLFAPGVSITSAWNTSDSDINTISGTSMATPHVAGVAALYLQGNPLATPATVSGALSAAATPDVVLSAGKRSPNLLLFTSW